MLLLPSFQELVHHIAHSRLNTTTCIPTCDGATRAAFRHDRTCLHLAGQGARRSCTRRFSLNSSTSRSSPPACALCSLFIVCVRRHRCSAALTMRSRRSLTTGSSRSDLPLLHHLVNTHTSVHHRRNGVVAARCTSCAKALHRLWLWMDRMPDASRTSSRSCRAPALATVYRQLAPSLPYLARFAFRRCKPDCTSQTSVKPSAYL